MASPRFLAALVLVGLLLPAWAGCTGARTEIVIDLVSDGLCPRGSRQVVSEDSSLGADLLLAKRMTPWFVNVSAAMPPPPPVGDAKVELQELRNLALARSGEPPTSADLGEDLTAGWTRLFLENVAEYSTVDGKGNPPRIARQMAMLEAGLSDTMMMVTFAQACYQRPPPSVEDSSLTTSVPVNGASSYPSMEVAVAAAATTMLDAFFPADEDGFGPMARNISQARMDAGLARFSDVEAGRVLGKAIARGIIDARRDDGAEHFWDGEGRIRGECSWEPNPPGFGGPMEPNWGYVRPFLLASGDQFRPPSPPACDSDAYVAEARAIYEASLNLTDAQRASAFAWAGGVGTTSPPGMWLEAALNMTEAHNLTVLQQTRVLAHVAAAMNDAAIASWDAKFAYWSDRPAQSVTRLFDPEWTSLVATPPFPGYVSGHSTFSGAGAQTLAHFFPSETATLDAWAEDAMMSRFWGGIHVMSDNLEGMKVGRSVGQLAAARAAAEGIDGSVAST